MVLKTTYTEKITPLRTSDMQPTVVNHRLFLGIVAFSVSFGLGLIPSWDFTRALFTGIITVISTYIAAFYVDQRRKNYEMLILASLQKRIREVEILKFQIIREINQIEEHRSILYAESQQLKNQIAQCRNQRDNLHRDLSNFVGQKKQLESEITSLKYELRNLEKKQLELKDSFAAITGEKRRLELTYNLSLAEITQLKTQIEQLQKQRQEIENNLTLLGRLKPQLEEKLYELRIEIQQLEAEITEQNQLFIATKSEKNTLESNLNLLKNQTDVQQSELYQLQEQISLLQEERDLLQSQVWELLQQMETLNQESVYDFPLAELREPLENLPQEWSDFLQSLPGHEIQVLKAILEQDNPRAMIKQIAEANITMPNLLIDSINEIANDTLGELIIETDTETPMVSEEHIVNTKKMLAMYEGLITRSAAPN